MEVLKARQIVQISNQTRRQGVVVHWCCSRLLGYFRPPASVHCDSIVTWHTMHRAQLLACSNHCVCTKLCAHHKVLIPLFGRRSKPFHALGTRDRNFIGQIADPYIDTQRAYACAVPPSPSALGQLALQRPPLS